MCMCIWGACLCHSEHVEVRGKLISVGSLLLPVWVMGLVARAFTQRVATWDLDLMCQLKLLWQKPNPSLPW